MVVFNGLKIRMKSRNFLPLLRRRSEVAYLLLQARKTHHQLPCYKAEKSAVGFDNYEDELKQFKLEVPKYFNFAKDVLGEWCKKEKSGIRNAVPPAFWWVDDFGNELQWGFEELLQKSNQLSNILSDFCDVKKGDCVIVILPRLPEWWLVNIACLQTGAIISPGTISLTANDIRNRLQTSKAKCIITIPEVAELVDEVAHTLPYLKSKLVVDPADKYRHKWLPLKQLMKDASTTYSCLETRSDDPMSWFFTSGTTGYPKMTEHSHVSYGLAHKLTGKYWLDLESNDVMWNVSDTGWAKSAYSSFFAPWWQGSCVFVHHTPRFDVRKTLEIMQKYPISVACLPPTAYRMMIQEDLSSYTFKALRHCVSAGEPLNPDVIEKWSEKTGLVIREGYGQTEMTLSCGIFRCLDVKPGSMGKPAPGYDIQIIDKDGEVVGKNVEGDVAVNCAPQRPVGLFTKYVNDEERTAAAFLGNFYLTGDRGYKDEDGYVWFVGRSDDVIISAGYRIGPFEVESALIEHPGVAESAVISSPCETRGAVVKAVIVLTPCHQKKDKIALTKEIQNHVKTLTAPYKYPRKIDFVDSLPKTISGKIRRVELREKEWSKNVEK